MKAGFSLVEMTIAMAIVLAATGAFFALMDPAHGSFHAQPEAIDQQQRLRVAVDALTRDLIMGGAGSGGYFASILPRRRGHANPDPPTAFFDDRISVIYVPEGAPDTVVSVATDEQNAVYVAPRPGCPAGSPLCGFVPGTLAAIYDAAGAHDTFRIDAVQTQPPALVYAGGPLSKTYPAGATITHVTSATYWLRRNASAGTSELMRYDGDQSDLPLSDDVFGLAFEYYGEPATGGVMSSLERLGEAQLTDGPWLPDTTAPDRFDADLLRIRRIRVTLRVRASGAFLREPLRDQQITFVVTPRNLSFPR